MFQRTHLMQNGLENLKLSWIRSGHQVITDPTKNSVLKNGYFVGIILRKDL